MRLNLSFIVCVYDLIQNKHLSIRNVIFYVNYSLTFLTGILHERITRAETCTARAVAAGGAVAAAPPARTARSLMPNLANILAAAPPKKNWRAAVARPRRLRLAFKFAAGRPRLDHMSCQDFFKSNFENQSQIYCLSATFMYFLC